MVQLKEETLQPDGNAIDNGISTQQVEPVVRTSLNPKTCSLKEYTIWMGWKHDSHLTQMCYEGYSKISDNKGS